MKNLVFQKRKALIQCSALLLSFVTVLSSLFTHAAEFELCEASAPLASWDFSAGELAENGSEVVNWQGDHNGIKNIPGTDKRGVEFFYQGKDPEGDATSEWRYEITSPLSHTWEYLRFLQPGNFYHRAYVRITAPDTLDTVQWIEGDTVVNDDGMEAKVGMIDDEYLYITEFAQRFGKNWGNGITISNTRSSAQFVSTGSRVLVYNNKFSTQWQGKYSNGGLTLETQALMPANGAELGVSYFRPTINGSVSHKGSYNLENNFFGGDAAVAFHPKDNGKIVEFVVERKRSSALTARDGGYRIWRKVEGEDWSLVFMDMQQQNFVEGANYFDNGYVLGWSNSGYSENTSFWLLGWQLWNVKPDFLKSEML